jgi:mRNA interferase MazF
VVEPVRGEIWWIDPDPVRGHEQGYRRPALVVSADEFNRGPQQLVMVLPITRSRRPYPFYVQIKPYESGLPATSYVMCHQLRVISTERILDSNAVGRLDGNSLSTVEDHLRTILQLYNTD